MVPSGARRGAFRGLRSARCPRRTAGSRASTATRICQLILLKGRPGMDLSFMWRPSVVVFPTNSQTTEKPPKRSATPGLREPLLPLKCDPWQDHEGSFLGRVSLDREQPPALHESFPRGADGRRGATQRSTSCLIVRPPFVPPQSGQGSHHGSSDNERKGSVQPTRRHGFRWPDADRASNLQRWTSSWLELLRPARSAPGQVDMG